MGCVGSGSSLEVSVGLCTFTTDTKSEIGTTIVLQSALAILVPVDEFTINLKT